MDLLRELVRLIVGDRDLRQTTDNWQQRLEEAKRHYPSLTCPHCGLTSFHPVDVRERYCANCHRFVEEAR